MPRPNGRFVDDVTIPDDLPVVMGQPFTKTWLLQNNGRSFWKTGYSAVFTGGEAMTAQRKVPLPVAAPGQHVQLTIQFTAPNRLGTFYSDWRFQDDTGQFFGEVFHTRIRAINSPPVAGKVNDSFFLEDVTIPDDSVIQPGAPFSKQWRVKNTGTQTWGTGYTLRFMEGNPMGQTLRMPLPNVGPGETAVLSIDLTAPKAPGTYWGDWKLYDPQDNSFGAKFWLRIVVPTPAGITAPVTTAPVTPAALTPVTPVAPVGATAPTPVAPTPAPSTPPSLAPHFSQRDPRWASIPLAQMAGVPTIGRWGCLLTSLTMLANSYGKSTQPDQFNRDMIQRNGFVNGYFTRWEALSNVYPDIIFEGKLDHPNAGLIGKIDQWLAAKRPVPVLVDLTPQTRYAGDVDQHWVVVVARAGNDFLVNDPAEFDRAPTSLMARYGKASDLGQTVLAGLFYRK